MNNEVVPSARDGQFVVWDDGKFIHAGWVVGESPDGETFYINAQTYDLSAWDFTLSRRVMVEAVTVRDL